MTELKMPSEVEYRILSLVFRERTGREVAKEFKRQTRRPVSYGTLYTTLRRLVELGWVSSRDDTDADGRLRYFVATGEGSRAFGRARDRYSALAKVGGAKEALA